MSAAELLKVEESVARLLQELEALRHEAGGYSHAKLHLEQAASAAASLAARLQEVAGETRDAVVAIRGLSMPAVMDRLGAFQAELKQMQAGIDARFGEVRSQQAAQLKDTMAEVRKQILAASEEAGRRSEVLQRGTADAMSSQIATGAKKTHAEIAELRSELGKLGEGLSGVRKATEPELKRLRTMATVQAALVGLLILAMVVSWLV